MAKRARPKTGEPRKTQQPFAIDKLPSEWRDKLIALLAKFVTYEQLEEESKRFDWAALEKTDPELVLSHFADHRIPKSTLHNWYDVQVRQKRDRIIEKRRISTDIADAFAQAGYEHLDETVKNALADAVLEKVQDSGDPEKWTEALQGLALVLTRFKRTEIAKQRADIDKERVDVDRKKLELLSAKVYGLKEDVVGKKKMSTEELANKLDEIYDIARPNA